MRKWTAISALSWIRNRFNTAFGRARPKRNTRRLSVLMDNDPDKQACEEGPRGYTETDMRHLNSLMHISLGAFDDWLVSIQRISVFSYQEWLTELKLYLCLEATEQNIKLRVHCYRSPHFLLHSPWLCQLLLCLKGNFVALKKLWCR